MPHTTTNMRPPRSGDGGGRAHWRQHLAGGLATAGLTYHAFFAMTDYGHLFKNEYGAMLALLAALLAGREMLQPLWSLRFLRWALVFTGYVLVQSWWCAHHVAAAPPYAKQLSAAGDAVRLGILSAVLGVWLARYWRWAPHLLALMALGYLSMLVLRSSWMPTPPGTWPRLRLVYSENIGGLFAGQLLIMNSILMICRRHRWWQWALLLAWWCALFACLALSQSRSALGATALGLLVACGGWAYSQKSRMTRRELLRPALLLLGLLLVCSVPLAPVLGQRVGGAESVMRPLLEHGVDAVPNSSAGLRIQLYALGLETFAHHPWLGIGMHTVQPLIIAHHIGSGGYTPPHLHNSYLQILVSLGLLGAAIVFAGLAGMLRDAWRAYRHGAIEPARAWLLAGWLSVLLADIMLDEHLWRHGYLRSTQELLFGLMLAGALRARSARAAPTTGATASDRVRATTT